MTTPLNLDTISRTIYCGNQADAVKHDLIREIRFLRAKVEYYERPTPRVSHADRERQMEHERYEKTCIVTGQNQR